MSIEEAIKSHLDKMAEQDPAFAERYKKEGKTLEKCISYITQQAKKQAKHGCAAVEDCVVYGWAVHYYQEEDEALGLVKNTPKAKVVVSTGKKGKKEEKPKEVKPIDVKPIKALVKGDKKVECIQLDLFGDF